MKFCIAVLLLSSLYLASALSDTEWTLIQPGLAANSPFADQLNQIGGQSNLGQAADSRLFDVYQGEVTDVYNSHYQYAEGSAFNYSAELQLTLGNVTIDSEYAIRIDPDSGAREIIGWSLEYLVGRNNGPAGTNITYDADSDTVTVTDFEGIDQWVAYQEGNDSTLNVTTFDGLRDYHANYIGYVAADPDNYTEDATLDNGVNNAIAGVAEAAPLANVNVTNVRTVDSYVDAAGAIWVRVDADITSDTNDGEIVAVVLCEAGSDCSDGALQYWWWKSVILG